MTKYQISMRDLQTQGGISKLQRDGFTREAVHRAMYKHTTGATTQEREKIMSKLYDKEK